jgi:ankyrin repeat protein
MHWTGLAYDMVLLLLLAVLIACVFGWIKQPVCDRLLINRDQRRGGFAVVAIVFALSLFVLANLDLRFRRLRLYSYAAGNGEVWIVNLCYRFGEEIDGGGPDPALVQAARNGRDSVIRFLLDHGADVNLGNKYRTPAIAAAAGNGRLATVRYLVSRGADVNASSWDEGSALHCARAAHQTAVVQYLEGLGAVDRAR